MSGDVRAAVEGLPWEAMVPEPSRSLVRAAVLDLIPKGAVLVTEETLRESLRQIQIWPADGDYAGAIVRQLWKETG